MAENFLDRLQPSGYIERLSYATFNNAARSLLNELSELAMELKPGATCFLEKTPHNLLQPQFLHELAPNARYLHIYRNPKAIAVSRSEEHTSELQSLMRISYAVFCLKKKNKQLQTTLYTTDNIYNKCTTKHHYT